MAYALHIPRPAALGLILAVWAAPALAATPSEVDRLLELMRVEELVAILRDEAVQQSELLPDDVAPGRGGSSWALQVSAIYDLPEMTADFRGAFAEELDATDVTPLIAFFGSDLGQRIVRVELDGRRAIADPNVEAAARTAVRSGDTSDGSRVQLLRDFIEANDLVDYNVLGALNANLAFLTGLSAGEGSRMSEAEIVATVWERESEIRSDSEEWLMAYLGMAYEPLSDADLVRYVDLSASEAGQDLNRALFVGFDTMFNRVSFDLGLAVSRLLTSEEL